nr:hypothetical protein [Tanacetum cinerariifolium]
DEDIFGVNDQDDTSMFDADKDLQGEEVVVEKEVVGKDVSAVEEVNDASITTPVSAAAITTTAATTPTISMDEITLAKAVIKLKTSGPKAKGIVMQEPSETPTPTSIVSSQQPSKVHDKGNEKGKHVCRYGYRSGGKLKKTKEIAQEGSLKRAGDELEQEIAKKQRIEDGNESVELKRRLGIVPDDGDDVTINATPLSSKSPTIVDYKIYKEGMKSFFQIFRVDGNEKGKHVCRYGYRSGGKLKKTKEIAQEGSSKRAGDELEQEIAKKQRIEDGNESVELKRRLGIVPDDGDDTPLLRMWLDIAYEIYASYSHCMLVNVVQVDNAEKYSIHDMQAKNRIRGDNNFDVYQVDFYKSEMEVKCSYSILESEVFDLYEIFESTIDRLVHGMDTLKIYKE